MIAALVQGWLTGLSTGAWCLGLCAPVLLPYLVSLGPSGPKVSARLVGEFLLGRAAAYFLYALLAAALGAAARDWPGLRALSAVAMIGLALMLLAHGLGHGLPDVRPCAGLAERRGVRRVPLLAGFALGLAPCVPLLAGLIKASTLGLGGALLFFGAFFAATSLWLTPVIACGRLGRSEPLRALAVTALMLSGLWYLAQGVCLLRGGS
jgi:sulfite exporter TauE/SafE